MALRTILKYLNAVTQDTSKTGAGIRTISLRIAGTEEAKKQLEEDGDDVADYIVQTASKTQKKIADFTKTASNKTGVNVLDDNGNLRNTYKIMLDISKVYKEIQEEDKKFGTNRASALVEFLAGKNRSNIAASILQNPEMLQAAYDAATHAAGSAAQENAKYLDSINGKMNQLKNEIQEIEYNIIDSGAIKDFLDLINGVVSAISKASGYVNSFTSLSTIAGGLFGLKQGITGNGFVDFQTLYGEQEKGYTPKQSFEEFNKYMEKYSGNVESLNAEINKYAQANSSLGGYLLEVSKNGQGAAASMRGYAGYLVSTKASTIALTAASTVLNTVISAGIALLVSFVSSKIIEGIEHLAHAEEEASENAHKLSEEYETLSKIASDDAAETKKLIERYEELSNGVDALGQNTHLTNEEFDEYHQLTNKIVNMFPSLLQGYDSEGNAILNLKSNLEELTQAYKDKQRAANDSIITAEDNDDIFNTFGNVTSKYSTSKIMGQTMSSFTISDQLDFLKDLSNREKPFEEILPLILTKYSKYNVDEVLGFLNNTLGLKGPLIQASSSSKDYKTVGEAYLDAFKNMDKWDIDPNTINSKILGNISVLESQLREETQPFRNLLNAVLSNAILDNEDLTNVDVSILTSIANGLSNAQLSEFGSVGEMSNWANELIHKLSESITIDSNKVLVSSALETLFNLQKSDLPLDEAKYIADTYVAALVEYLGIDINQLRTIVGADTVDSLYSNLQSVKGLIPQNTSRGHYKSQSALFDNLVKQYKVNTQDEIAALYDAMVKANGDVMSAFDIYAEDVIGKKDSGQMPLAKWLETDEDSKKAIDDYVSNMSGDLKSALDKFYDPKDNFDREDLLNLIPDIEPYLEDTDDFFSIYYNYMVGKRDELREMLEERGADSETISSLDTYLNGIEREGLYALGYNDDWMGQVAAYKELLEVREEIANGQVIEQDRMVDLIKKYPDLSKAIKKSADGYTIFDDELVNVINDMASSANTAISSGITFTNNMLETIKRQISILEIGGEAWEEYWQKVDGVFRNGTGATAKDYYGNISDIINSTYASANDEIKNKINKWRSENRGDEYVYQKLLAETALGDYKDNTSKLLDLLDNLEDSNKVVNDNAAEQSLSEYDYLTQTLQLLNNEVDKYQSKLDNTAGLNNQIAATDNLIDSLKNLKSGYASAADEYEARWLGKNVTIDGKRINLRKNLTDAISKNGDNLNPENIYSSITQGIRMDATQYSSDTASAISALVDAYNSYVDAEKNVVETQRQINEVLAQRADLIKNQFDKIISEYENRKNVLDADISYQTSKGYMDNVNLYKTMIDNEVEIGATRLREQKRLMSEFNDLQKTGWKDAGFKSFKEAMKDKTFNEAFWNMKNSIDEVNLSLMEGRQNILDWSNEIRQIEWDVFDKISDSVNRVSDEIEFLVDYLGSNRELFTDEGILEDEGLATFGLYVTNLRAISSEADRIKSELTRVNNELANDPANTTLLDRRNELLDQQRDLIQSNEDVKSSIIDLVQEGFDKELNSLQEIIDKYKEAINAERDLYTYQKDVASKTKDIAKLRKQIAAYANDSSEEAKAKIQQLNVSLSDSEEDLRDTQYDRYISDQEKILDEVYNEYEKFLNDAIKNTDGIISGISAKVDSNSAKIKDIIEVSTDKVNYDVTDTLNSMMVAQSFTNVEAMMAKSDLDIVAIKDSAFGISQDLASYLEDYGEEINEGELETEVENFSSTVGNIDTNLSALIQDKTLKASINKIDDILEELRTRKSTRPDDTELVNNLLDYSKANSGAFGSAVESIVGMFSPKKSSDQTNEVKYNKLGKYYEAYIDSFEYSGLGMTQEEAETDLLDKMKKKGFNAYAKGSKKINDDEWAWTQENGQEVIMRPSDGAILTPLAKNDSVLTANATQNLWDMANDPGKFIKAYSNFKMHSVSPIGGGKVDNNIQMSVVLPNVTNYNEFVTQLQKDKRFESMIQDMTVNQLTGQSPLSKFKYKF